MNMQTDSPRLVVPNKSFFVKERQFYRHWRLAFWRELFQNSVDAGAKRIEIRIEDAVAKGSFGRAPENERVTRISFADDGIGMSKEVLDEVYFRMGATTKADDETTVGGFGRARILTCFSQARYSIETLDRYVEGDGAEFVNLSRQEAIESLDRWTQAANMRMASEPGGPDQDRMPREAEALSAERKRLQDGGDRFAGCRLEIDLPPPAAGAGSLNDTSPDAMREVLRTYLAESDIAAEVVVDGVPAEKPSQRYERKRHLTVNMKAEDVEPGWKDNRKIAMSQRPDGSFDVRFASVRMLSGERMPDAMRKRMVVRVRGASMYAERTDVEAAIYLEIEPALARAVLTSNRDGLKDPFAGAVTDYQRLLATDAQKATSADDEHDFTVLSGGLGRKIARRPLKNGELSTADAALLAGPEGDSLVLRIERQDRCVNYYDASWTWTDLVEGKSTELQRDLLLPWLSATAKLDRIDGTFLERYSDRGAAESFLLTLKNSPPHRALAQASGTLLGFISDNLVLQDLARQAIEREKYKDRLAELNDIPILKENLEPPADRLGEAEARKRRGKLNEAIRRHDPRKWDGGKGLRPRRVLAAWQASVDNVVTLLLQAYPHVEEFPYATGWVFSHPQWTYNTAKGDSAWMSPAAMLRKDRKGPGATAHFLLDPLDAENDFAMKYNPSDPDDRDRLISLAAHEAAHVIADGGHNDAFAEVLTELMELLTIRERKRIHDEIKTAVKAAEKVAAEGRTRIVPMDDEPGPRPAERLAAALALDASIDGPETSPDADAEIDAEHGPSPGI